VWRFDSVKSQRHEVSTQCRVSLVLPLGTQVHWFVRVILLSKAIVGYRRVCPRCNEYFFICTSCDRGHWYCSPLCSEKARLASKRNARQKYQGSEKGKISNRRAQKIFREKLQIVSHQSSHLGPIHVFQSLKEESERKHDKKNEKIAKNYWCRVCGRSISHIRTGEACFSYSRKKEVGHEHSPGNTS